MANDYDEKQVVKAEKIVNALKNLKIDTTKEVRLYILNTIANASIHVINDIISLINGKIITTENDLLKIFPKLKYAYSVSLDKEQDRIEALDSKIRFSQYEKLGNIVKEKNTLYAKDEDGDYIYGDFLNSYKEVVKLYELFYKKNSPFFDKLIQLYSNLNPEPCKILNKLTNHPTFWKNNNDVNNLLSYVSECTAKSTFGFTRKAKMRELSNYVDQIINNCKDNEIEERIKQLLK